MTKTGRRKTKMEDKKYKKHKGEKMKQNTRKTMI